MKKLIKISEYYFVIDDKAEINKTYYYNAEFNEVGYDSGILTPDETHFAIIASNNPSLPLPQITNPSDELVGKEVEVEFDLVSGYTTTIISKETKQYCKECDCLLENGNCSNIHCSKWYDPNFTKETSTNEHRI